jgi:hypothetical protein
LLPAAAVAQSAPAFGPPDRETMARAVSDVPMSLSAHQQVLQIIANVQREAQMRDARCARESGG